MQTMWITTSKNADADVKKLAARIAGALPEYGYFARGDRAISKVDRLAQRGGIVTYLMAGKSNTAAGKFAVWSRKYVADGDSAFWMWNSSRMEDFSIKGEKPEFEEPTEFEWKENAANDSLAQFLGYVKGKPDEIYEECCRITVEAKKNGAKLIEGGKAFVEMGFAWKGVTGREKNGEE